MPADVVGRVKSTGVMGATSIRQISFRELGEILFPKFTEGFQALREAQEGSF